MDEKIVITISGNINTDIAARIRDIALAATEAHTDLAILKNELKSFSAVAGLRQAAADTRKFKSEVTGVNSEAKKLAGTLKSIDNTTINLRKNSSALGGSLNGLLAGFSLLFIAREWTQASDALTTIQNKLRGLTPDIERQVALQQELFRVANLTRSGIEGTTDGFVRFSKALNGASDVEVLRFVETLNKQLIVAGRTSGEVNSIVVQLGQALTSGRLQGDEFRSLSENLPREALEEFAKVLGVGVDQLKQLSSEGKITSEVIREAMANLADSADAAFARTIPTIEQAITVLNNKFIEWTKNTSAGAQLVALAIGLVGENLNIIVPLVVALGAAWAIVKTVGIVQALIGITAALVAMAPVLVTNAVATIALVAPWVLLAGAILTAAGVILMLTGQWDNFTKFISSSLKPVEDMAVKLGLLSDGLSSGSTPANALAQAFGGMGGEAKAASSEVSELGNATEKASKKIVAANDNIIRSYFKLTAARTAANKANYDALVAAGGTSGSFTALGSPTGSGTGSITKLPAMARGGTGIVKGRSSGDKNVVRFRANEGERVTVETRKQQRENDDQQPPSSGAPTFVFNIQTPDADSFRLSRGQMASDMAASLNRG